MAIADKLTRLAQTKSEIKTALIAKGSDPGNAPFKDYPGLIENIQSGGGGDTSVEDGLIEGTLTGEYANDRVTKIRGHAFRDCLSLTTVNFPAAESVGQYVFDGCSSMTTANFPVATSVGVGAFYKCSSLTTADLPAATSVGDYTFYGCSSLTTASLPAATSVGNYAFNSCSSLEIANLPVAKSADTSVFNGCSSLTTVNLPAVTSIKNNAFYNCPRLLIVDFPLATSISIYAFQNCYRLTTLILRNTTQVCSLSNTNALMSCYHYHGTVNSKYNPDGLQDGYIYVPASLIEDYKANTNWSTFATQFRALEDYTVDGTTTGELDESKI